MPIVEQSTFRMLEPSEIGGGMVMHLTATGVRYVIHGTLRQQVRQMGSAVTPPVAAWLAARIRAALQGRARRGPLARRDIINTRGAP